MDNIIFHFISFFTNIISFWIILHTSTLTIRHFLIFSCWSPTIDIVFRIVVLLRLLLSTFFCLGALRIEVIGNFVFSLYYMCLFYFLVHALYDSSSLFITNAMEFPILGGLYVFVLFFASDTLWYFLLIYNKYYGIFYFGWMNLCAKLFIASLTLKWIINFDVV